MKRKISTLSFALICMAMAILTTGTLAYFSAEGTAQNVITTGNINIEVMEQMREGDKLVDFPEGGISGVMPGAEISKIVQVKNTGDFPAYIRVSVDTIITLAEGMEGEVDLSLVNIDFNDKDWIYRDGFYYYGKPLIAGALTEPLFTTVTFDSAMGNLYQDSQAVIEVKAYATQTDNNGDSALDAAGWPKE